MDYQKCSDVYKIAMKEGDVHAVDFLCSSVRARVSYFPCMQVYNIQLPSYLQVFIIINTHACYLNKVATACSHDGHFCKCGSSRCILGML